MRAIYTRPGVCKYCGVGINHRAANAVQCGACWLKVKAERAANYYQRKKEEGGKIAKERYCALCGVDISKRGNTAYRCVACQKLIKNFAANGYYHANKHKPARIAAMRKSRKRSYEQNREKLRQIRAEAGRL